MKITKANLHMARETLESDATLEAIGQKHGCSRACVWQNLKRFVRHFMLDHERLDDSGKLKNLDGLRAAWRGWNRV